MGTWFSCHPLCVCKWFIKLHRLASSRWQNASKYRKWMLFLQQALYAVQILYEIEKCALWELLHDGIGVTRVWLVGGRREFSSSLLKGIPSLDWHQASRPGMLVIPPVPLDWWVRCAGRRQTLIWRGVWFGSSVNERRKTGVVEFKEIEQSWQEEKGQGDRGRLWWRMWERLVTNKTTIRFSAGDYISPLHCQPAETAPWT